MERLAWRKVISLGLDALVVVDERLPAMLGLVGVWEPDVEPSRLEDVFAGAA